MRIIDELHKYPLGTDGFELDGDKFVMKSTSRKRVELPYTGRLPGALKKIGAARVRFNVQPFQKPNLILMLAPEDGGKDVKIRLDAGASEVRDVLDVFFHNTHSSLDAYWNAVWRIDYVNWRRCSTSAVFLAGALSNAPREDLSYLKRWIEHLLDAPQG